MYGDRRPHGNIQGRGHYLAESTLGDGIHGLGTRMSLSEEHPGRMNPLQHFDARCKLYELAILSSWAHDWAAAGDRLLSWVESVYQVVEEPITAS